MFRHTISSYSFWCSETYGLMKLFHLCSLVSIADKENGVSLVFFLHHSSSVSRDWEEETGPSFLRIPQVQAEGSGYVRACQQASVPIPRMLQEWREERKKEKGEKNPTKTPKTVLVSHYLAAFITIWMISSETALVPRPWHGPLMLWCKIGLFSACFWWNLESVSSSPSWEGFSHSFLCTGTQPFGTGEGISRISRIVLAALQVIRYLEHPWSLLILCGNCTVKSFKYPVVSVCTGAIA